MIEQSTLDYDDMFAGMNSEILKNIFIRFYTMQDYFQFSTPVPLPNPIQPQSQPNPNPNPDQSTPNPPQPHPSPQPKKSPPVYMHYNRLIQQSIYDLYIMNKLINSKAKLVHSILDNGQSIAQKKNDTWVKFIQRDCFWRVRKAYQAMPEYKRDVVKFAVLSISNLLLKLSINMSKVSVIPIQKFLNYECLNIPTLSVAFLQNLQSILFTSKNLSDPTQKLAFMRQLPKITYIKFNKYKNNTDFHILQTSQHEFISSKVDQPVKNLQYIEIYEEDRDLIFGEFQRKSQYPYMHRFDLGKIGGRVGGAGGKGFRASFGFEVLEIMRQIVFPLVREFRPDQIVYMESYPSDVTAMNDQVRGLMLCQMAEQTTCNKMYVFMEVGVDKFSLQPYRNTLQKYTQQSVNEQFSTIFLQQQKRLAKLFRTKPLTLKPEPAQKQHLNKIKKIFLNQLCYISLALIQKVSFDDLREKSYREIFDVNMLKGIQNQLVMLDGNKELMVGGLKARIQGVRMMRGFAQARSNKKGDHGLKIISLVTKQNHFTTFYNLQQDQQQPLLTLPYPLPQPHPQPQLLTYTEQDTLVAKYLPNKVLVILIKYKYNEEEKKSNIEIIFLEKIKEEKMFRLVGEGCWVEEEIQGAIYVCSNQYLYRGFGKYKNRAPKSDKQPQEIYNKSIHRMRLTHPPKSWQLVSQTATLAKPIDKQQPKMSLESKVHGYGIHDVDNKAILMMGGYVDSYNQERISKNIYYIKGCDCQGVSKGGGKGGSQGVTVSVLSKTNKILYNTSSEKLKDIFLYPFVFGIPFFFGNQPTQPQQSQPTKPKGSFVLNSNGNYLHLNHHNKIFMTSMKLSSITMYNGINMQNKLYISNNVDDAAMSIFLSEVLGKCLVLYPHQVNVREQLCCVRTLEEGAIVMRADLGGKGLEVKAKGIFQDQEWRGIKFY